MSNQRQRKKARNQAAFPNKKELYTHNTSVDFLGLVDYLPNPDQIQEEMGENQKLYESIMTDPHLTGAISQRKKSVEGMLWEIDRGKAKSEQAKFVEETIKNLDVYRIISDILDAPYYGMSPVEVIWAKPVDGKIVPAQVIGKPPEWFQFDMNNVLRYISRDNQIKGEEIKPRKIILARHNPTYKNPYGDPLLSKIFWPVTFKKGGLKFWVQFSERFGMPLVVGKVPRAGSEAEYQALADQLADTVQDGIIVMPKDSEVDIVEGSKSGGSAVFQDLLVFVNQEISKAILGQTLTTEASSTGTQALGTVHMEVKENLITADKRMVEGCFDTLIRWILEVNFGNSKDAPAFTLYTPEEINLDQVNRDKLLSEIATVDIEFSQEYIDQKYGFKPGEVTVNKKEIAAPVVPGKKDSKGPNLGPKKEDGTNDDEEFEEHDHSHNFTESIFKDQRAIDFLIESLGPKDYAKQAVFVKPLNDLGQSAENYKEFSEGLIKIFPEVRPEEMEKTLRNFLFVAQTWGMITGAET